MAAASAAVAATFTPCKHAVARDVGEDDGGDARVLETLRQFGRGEFGRLRPAFDGDLAVLRIDADRDAAGMRAAPLLSPAPDFSAPRCRG